MTSLTQLIAIHTDSQGYITYVFKCLEDEGTDYIMCVRYPNWNHRPLILGEIGFLNYVEVRAGIDSWYNGNEMVPYKYNAIQFIKFIEKPKDLSQEYIM